MAKPRKLTREQSLAARPVRLVDPALQVLPDGAGKLVVPVAPPRFARWLLPAGNSSTRTKTFEFDAVGVFVWNSIDGKRNVEQLIRRLASEYHLELRQAEASLSAFFKTLMQRGLIGMVESAQNGRGEETKR